MITKGTVIEKDVRLQNFIVFEPSSQRISPSDVLARGYRVKEIFDEVSFVLSKGRTLQDLIIQNRLTKMQKMLDLVTDYDNIILTRFFDRIWRRYANLSHLGETFLDLKTFFKVYPEYKDDYENVVAFRMYDEDEKEDETETDEDQTEKVENLQLA